VELVLGQRSCIGECLSDVFLFEIRQVGDDLRWRHAVGHKVDDVGDGDAEATDRRAAGQHIRILREPVERVRHLLIIRVYVSD
jgi:hypothetical protein